jgi:hypothetical protein
MMYFLELDHRKPRHRFSLLPALAMSAGNRPYYAQLRHAFDGGRLLENCCHELRFSFPGHHTTSCFVADSTTIPLAAIDAASSAVAGSTL